MQGTIKLVPLALFLMFALASADSDVESSENSLVRLVRSATKNKQDACKYEKQAWEDCDTNTGLQRRALKLKETASSASAQCEPQKYLSRPCKKTVVCKYVKGTFSECVHGTRTRVDQVRNAGAGCEETRTITRKCKTACRYAKSDWTTCENGVKSKTLTLSEGDSKDCEVSKTITKECADEQTKKRSKPANKQRGRKKIPAVTTDA